MFDSVTGYLKHVESLLADGNPVQHAIGIWLTTFNVLMAIALVIFSAVGFIALCVWLFTSLPWFVALPLMIVGLSTVLTLLFVMFQYFAENF